MNIERAELFDVQLLAEINGLLSQLSTSAAPLSVDDFRTILASEITHLLLAMDKGRLCGMLTVVVFRIPTGVRAWIEDVVVDEAQRGKGIAGALLDAAIRQARALGANTLDLTSRPAREAANRLYLKAGFEQRATNVYRMLL